MKYTVRFSLVCLLSIPAVALAGAGDVGHSNMQGMHMQGGQAMHDSMAHNSGIGMVNHIDMQNGKVNLTHGPISSLGWPGMTMDFRVKDKSLLKGIKPGDKVEFNLLQEGPGQFFIDHIAPAH